MGRGLITDAEAQEMLEMLKHLLTDELNFPPSG